MSFLYISTRCKHTNTICHSKQVTNGISSISHNVSRMDLSYQTFIKQKENEMATKIQKTTSAYNSRRYSKPWIAKVDFTNNPRGDFSWGTWVGDHRSGTEGLLVITAEEGDIIAHGQKDFRGNNTKTTYCQVQNGNLAELSGKVEAYQLSVTK